MFIDSDDFLLPGAIDAMLDTAFAHDCDLVECGAYYVYDDRKSVMHRYESDRKVSDPYTLHGHAWGKLYRGTLFEHLCFPEGYWYEDSLLSYLIFPNAKNVWVTGHMPTATASTRPASSNPPMASPSPWTPTGSRRR